MKLFLAFVPFVVNKKHGVVYNEDTSGYIKAFRDEPSLVTSMKRLGNTGLMFCNTSADCKGGEVCMDFDKGKFGMCVRKSFFE